MKYAICALTLAAALIGFAPAEATHNDAQSGDNGDCLDFNVLYNVPGVFSPTAVFVDVTPGHAYTISSSSGTPFVDFYDADGAWITWNGGEGSGTTPEDAATGAICVGGVTGTYPDVPEVGATWEFTN